MITQALKALAHVRMNKIEESLPLCDEILASKPTDLETLNAMMHVLRALGRRMWNCDLTGVAFQFSLCRFRPRGHVRRSVQETTDERGAGHARFLR